MQADQSWRQAFIVTGQPPHLAPLRLVGRGDGQRQQVAQRVDHGVLLVAFAPFVPVVTAPPAALRGGLDGATVNDGGAGVGPPALQHAGQLPQSMRHHLETTGLEPAAQLRVQRQTTINNGVAGFINSRSFLPLCVASSSLKQAV